MPVPATRAVAFSVVVPSRIVGSTSNSIAYVDPGVASTCPHQLATDDRRLERRGCPAVQTDRRACRVRTTLTSAGRR